MFTGIVEEMGVIRQANDDGRLLALRIEAPLVTSDLAIGDSVAVSGCCLTATRIDGDVFEVELMKESVAKTAPRWHEGARVNLERAMRADARFGGHIVTGHVEVVGDVTDVQAERGAYVVTIRAPDAVAGYLIPKGSVTVDGVSLTVVDVGGPGGTRPEWEPGVFTLWLIPHTLGVTTLGALGAGDRVNLELDPIAKYVERLTLLGRTT